MRPQNDGQGYVLSTGRAFYANCGVIGISGEEVERDPEDAVIVREGFDGDIRIAESKWADDTSEDWTPDERRELADYMIALWQRWRATITG